MNRKSPIVVLVLILLTMALVGAAWAADTSQPHQRVQDRVVRGTVTAVDGSTVWVETPGGTEHSFAISGEALVWVPGEPPTPAIQLAVGDSVLAIGRNLPDEAGDSTPMARLILIAEEEELPVVLIRVRALAVTQQTIVVQSGSRGGHSR